ncbi:MAG: alpha/beta fold hydrolase [Planctomycetaceae bacterium]
MPRVELSDGSISYVDIGQGAPLLFIHGFPLDHTMWRHQIDDLQADYRVLAVDLPGFGQSQAPRSDMSIAGFADCIAEFLDRIGMTKPITLCGLSMGGSIALQFALRHPQRLARLILCDCRAMVDAPEAQKMRLDLAERVLTEGPEFVAAAMPARLFAAKTIEQHPDIVQSIQAVIRSTASTSVAGGSRALAHREDVVSRLGEIRVPTLIIVGSEDVISTSGEMKAMAERIPLSRHVEIPGAGHMAPLEAPAQVNTEIRSWLASHST